MFNESYRTADRAFATLVYQSENAFRYVRTTRRGVKVFAQRTPRGRAQHTRIWARKYPKLFTKDALKSILGN